MNPTIDPGVIAGAYERDAASASAEYGALFRRDIESYVQLEALEALVIPERHSLPPVEGVHYFAFVDPSGGSQDSMTLAVAHREKETAVLDLVLERRPPFSPEDVVEDFVLTLKEYGVFEVNGDRYAAEWCSSSFRKRSVSYETSRRTKSDLYRELIPLLNSAKLELLDHRRLVAQLSALERRTARSGKDSIDHPPGAHDDVANAAAGALVLAAHQAQMLHAAPSGPRRASLWLGGGDDGSEANDFEIRPGIE